MMELYFFHKYLGRAVVFLRLKDVANNVLFFISGLATKYDNCIFLDSNWQRVLEYFSFCVRVVATNEDNIIFLE
jgi:hypothetical protein